jgi:hypothetical protein
VGAAAGLIGTPCRTSSTDVDYYGVTSLGLYNAELLPLKKLVGTLRNATPAVL